MDLSQIPILSTSNEPTATLAQPVGEYILVKKILPTTAGSLLLPQMVQEQRAKAQVVKLGEGVTIAISVGDFLVLFNPVNFEVPDHDDHGLIHQDCVIGKYTCPNLVVN